MKEVASLAGVSVSTVSRVLNRDRTVRPERVARVLDAVQLLGFRRDDVASTLRRATGGSVSIGLVVEDVGNPFFSAVHRGVEDVARARGVSTLAGRELRRGRRAGAQAGRRLLGPARRRADHRTAGEDHGYLRREQAAGMALVFLDRPPRFLDVDAVLSDNLGGVAGGVAHLIAAGHRRIGYLGGREPIHTAVERLAGFPPELARHGIAENPRHIRRNLHDDGDAHAAARQLLQEPDPPTALLSAQNLLTMGAIGALHDLRLQDAVAHVGFDDLPLAEFLDPGLTVVAQNPRGLGQAAAERLFSRLDGNDRPFEQLILPTTLIARGSGQIAPPEA